MRTDATPLGADERAASETSGTIILIGIALVGAIVVVGAGSVALDSVDQQVERENAKSVLQEVDSRFDSLISSADTPRTTIDFGDSNRAEYQVAETGYINITVNDRAACSMNKTLSGIRYEGADQQSYLYQMGGVWVLNGDNSHAMTIPNFDYRDGAIDVSMNNISGHIDGSEATLTQNISQSRQESTAAQSALTQGECRRPNSVSVELSSPAYKGWAAYLEDETDTTVTEFDSNQTVQLHLEQSQLPERANDSENSVVNLSSSASYMSDVTLDASSGTISVSKDANNTYPVFAEPLTEDRLDIARIRFLEDTSNTTRQPLDVVMVIDESGSMNWEADGDTDDDDCDDPDPSCTDKMAEAKEAAKSFVADMNSSRDRIGVVSFGDYEPGRVNPPEGPGETPKAGGDYHPANGEYLSSDFTAVNNSIDGLPVDPRYGTDIEHGLFKANNILGLKSNESRQKVIIALTDGNNDECDDNDNEIVFDCDPDSYDADTTPNNRAAMESVNQSARDGTTIYTIGVGSDGEIDEPPLELAAYLTDGSYYQAENADELDSVFEEIRQDVNEQRFVSRTPLSTNFTDGSGNIVTPQIAGDTGDIANFSSGSHTFQNVNDPTAPSKFSHSFTVSGGKSVDINLTTYDCDQYEAIDKTYTNNSNTYSVVRCADIDETAGVNQTFRPSTILTDGDDADPLIDSNPGFWENELNETLTQYPTVTLNGTTGKLSMESNQALVVFDLPDSRQSENKMAILYEVGLAESETSSAGVINVDVNDLNFE